MRRYNVTIREVRVFVIEVEARDTDDARVKAVEKWEADTTIEPDSSHLDTEDCDVEAVGADTRSADRIDGYDRDDLGLSPDY